MVTAEHPELAQRSTAHLRLSGRPVAVSTEELLAGASSREPMKTADSLSGAPFERVVIDGSSFVVKYLCVDDDWIMRATGDLGCRAVTMWRSGMLDALPGCIDHTVVGAAWNATSRQATLLMRDVASFLVVEEAPLSVDQHTQFLDHMAAMHAHFWGFGQDDAQGLGLMAPQNRYTVLSPLMAETEAALGHRDGVPLMIPAAYAQLRSAVPDLARVVEHLALDATAILEALATTPSTFIHHDWKAGNLGVTPTGRTILLDWAFPGAGEACLDLAWYLAVNCDRLPISKEATIECYRCALEAHGISTAGWFETQLGLCLLSAFCELGWSKVGGDPAEFGWWVDRVRRAARWL